MARREPLKAVHALVIDDNEHMVTITSTMLRAFGFGQILSAEGADEGLKILENTAIDLIVVDYCMPNMNGIEFIYKIRNSSMSKKRFIPIIMLTAYSDKLRIIQARDKGVTEFLRKPLSPTELFKKIATVVNNPRPFICTEDFFGPDRRRRQDPEYNGPERRRESEVTFVEEISA